MRMLRLFVFAPCIALWGCPTEPTPECTVTRDCPEGMQCVELACSPVPDAGCLPTGEDDTCDGVDDDCDGIADEGWRGEEACGVGACHASSTAAACVDGAVTECAPGAPAAADDACDGVDDDCDGVADEGWVGEASCGIGPCAAASTPASCAGGVMTPCEPGPPGVEACNGEDDDCDGAVDETFDLSQDVAHCGACGAACAFAGGVPFCRGGGCRMARCAAGFSDCNADDADGCETEGGCPPDSVCDGVDEDGDGAVDEGYVPVICGVGLCGLRSTPSACVDGAPRACAAGAPGLDDTCNGLDEDCDGVADEGYVPEGCGVGACAEGATPSRCEGGAPVACVAGAPGVEVCDGRVDEDCDGAVDEGFDLSGDPRHCGRCGRVCARPGAEGLCVGGDCVPGPCAAGFADCNGDPGDGCEVEGACPPDAACDGIDDDGDGRVDEGFAPGRGCGVGACAAGVTPGSCVDGELFPCRPGPPSEEIDGICDGVDGDCDGRVDEGYLPDASCGVGACAAGVVPSGCEAGDERPCAVEVAPGEESCDGVDEDCDGAVDEGFAVGAACAVGVGLCARAGRLVCADGSAVCDAAPGAPVDDVRCDGLDADCDGVADEGFAPYATAECAGVGACAAPEAPVRCVDGAEVDCVARAPVDEVCNAIDDDCDGLLDEQAFDGFEPVYVPFAVEPVNGRRRSRDATLAWSGETLGVSWWEQSTDDADPASWRAAFTLLDRDGAVRLASSRVVEDGVAGRRPRLAWGSGAFTLVWHRTEGDDGLYATRLDPAGDRIGAVVEVAAGDSFPSQQALIHGPAGPLVGWHLTRGAVDTREVRVDRVGLDGIEASTQITSNDVPDRGPALVALGETVGAAWRRWTEPEGDAGSSTVWFRLVDADGRPVTEAVEVGPLGGAGELPDPDIVNDERVSVAAFARGFDVIWIAEDDGRLVIRSRRLSPGGQLDGALRQYVRDGRLRSRTAPAMWIPRLESVVVAWSEELEGRARIFIGLLDPVTGALARAQPLPASEGEQVRPTALAWLGDRLAVAYEETRGPDDWRLAVAIGTPGCGRERCVGGASGAGDGTCDGLDDDCDGRTDEGHAPRVRCGVGTCASRAVPESDCIDGRSVACRPGEPADEVCNGLDDDCDGVVDEPRVVAGSYFEEDAGSWIIEETDSNRPHIIHPDTFEPDWLPSGGASGGYISEFDPNNRHFAFSMPNSLLGDRSAARGGWLRFWLRVTHNNNEESQQVILYGMDDDTWLSHRYPHAALRIGRWLRMEVVLEPQSFVDRSGEHPTDAAFDELLGGLGRVLITGDTGSGLIETTDLDSVEWVEPTCP